MTPSTNRLPRLIAAIALIGLPVPSLAQVGPPATGRPASSLTLGLGAGVTSTYEGSRDYRIIPGGALRATVAGRDVFLRGLQLYAEAVPDWRVGELEVTAGAVAGLRLNRNGKVGNAQVAALGKRDPAVELGGFLAAQKTGLLTRSDSLTARATYVTDVASAHGGQVFTPSLEYGRPIGRRTYASVVTSAEIVGDRFANYYFDVTPEGARASGLRAFSTKGGFKSWGTSLILTHSLKGGRKGPALFLLTSYSRLRGDFARSPIVRDVGDPNQFFGAAGVAYTF